MKWYLNKKGWVLAISIILMTGYASAQEGIDVVFKIDESGSMIDDINEVKANVVTIFNALPSGSQVGLVGYGATLAHTPLNNMPHVHASLTDDQTVLENALTQMLTSGGIEPGYNAVYESATDTLDYPLGFRGVSYCNVLISDEPSNGDTVTQQDAIDAMLARPGVFFGVVSNFAAASYQNIADQTGGQIFDLVQFRADPTGLITAVIDACKAAVSGRMTGGGSIPDESGAKVSHGFELHCTTSEGPNNLQVNWSGNSFHMETMNNAICFNDDGISEGMPVAGLDTIRGTGTGRLNGDEGATVEFVFTDAGEPGKNNDSVSLLIKDASNSVVLSVTDSLLKGNHQAHTSNIE